GRLHDLGVTQHRLDAADAGLHEPLLVLRGVVLGVLTDVAVLPCGFDAFRDRIPTRGGELLQLRTETAVRVQRERRRRLLACGAAFTPRSNAPKTRSRSSGRSPGPSSSTARMAPPLPGWTRIQIWEFGGVCRAAFTNRFSTIRSTFGTSIATVVVVATTDTSRSATASDSATTLRTTWARSTVARCGSRSPCESRSRSSRSVTSRSSLRALP